MRRLNAARAAILFMVTTFLLIVINAAIAGREKVAFPAYQTHVLYDVWINPTFRRFGKPT